MYNVKVSDSKQDAIGTATDLPSIIQEFLCRGTSGVSDSESQSESKSVFPLFQVAFCWMDHRTQSCETFGRAQKKVIIFMTKFIRRFILQFLVQHGSFKTFRTRLASFPCLANTELSDFESSPSFIDSSWLSNNPEGRTSPLSLPLPQPVADSPEESYEESDFVLLLLCGWDPELLEVLESESESESVASNRCNMADFIFMESFEHQSWFFGWKANCTWMQKMGFGFWFLMQF